MAADIAALDTLDPAQLDRIEAKLDAVLAFADRVEQITAQLGQLDPSTLLRGMLGR